MPVMKYVILQSDQGVQFVEMPSSYAYQLTALMKRLHKEINKLTADQVPALPHAVAECTELEITDESVSIMTGLDYLDQLERSFSQIEEQTYPLISLLTEIRALLAQMEQWYEEEAEEVKP